MGAHSRTLYGGTKLFAHPQSLRGVGIWGGATLPHPEEIKAPIALEFVLREFLNTERAVDSSEILAFRLSDWLNGSFPRARQRIGIDIAALDRTDSGYHPAVYRLTNSASIEADIERFRVHRLRRRGPFHAESDEPLIVGGDINAAVWVEELRAAIRLAADRTFTELPNDLTSLRQRLAVLVRSVSDLYRVTGLGESIGGPVATLSIEAATGTIVLNPPV
jgi:hypothetical protein